MEKLIEQFSFGLFFWQTLLFLILFIALWKFAWKPILEAVENREKGIEDSLLQAEKAKKEMAKLNAENEKIMQEAREERDAMLKEAREMKDQTIASAKEAAQKEADKIISSAKVSIQNEKNAAMADIKTQVANLSLEVAEKVLGEHMGAQDSQKKLVDKLVDQIKLS